VRYLNRFFAAFMFVGLMGLPLWHINRLFPPLSMIVHL
jgi:hypothetical protein